MKNPLLPVVMADSFFEVDMRVGVVVEVRPFPEARKPAYQIFVDFGPGVGVRKTSAQVTARYTPEALVGRKVVGWVNAPARQIGPFMSEFLLLGVAEGEGAIRLLHIEGAEAIEIGARVC